MDDVRDDVRDDVIIARPFETDDRIFSVWHKYFDATFVIAACILMLVALEIYVAIDIDVLGFVWRFAQLSFTIRPTFPLIRRNVVFVCATS